MGTAVKMSDVVYAVAAITGVKVHAILGPSRKQPIYRARFIAYYYCRKLTKQSLPRLGKFFDRDHTSILNGLRRMDDRISVDPGYIREIEEKFFAALKVIVDERNAERIYLMSQELVTGIDSAPETDVTTTDN